MNRALMMIAVFTVAALSSTVTGADAVPDWSKYKKHSVVKGTIVSADENGITIEVPKLEPKKTNGSTSSSSKSKKPNVKVGHEHVDYKYAPNGLVRRPKMPTVSDGKGGTIMASSKELEAAMQPIGAPGYKAEKSELKAGMIVEVTLVAPSDMPASKVTEADLSIKYVMIDSEGKAPATTDKKTK